jgi:hypothetical protein
VNAPPIADRVVGTTHEDGRTVFQCSRTGLLYAFADPPKRYLSVSGVRLTSPEDTKEKGHARKRNAAA